MQIELCTTEETCIKCDKKAIYTILINGKKYYSCEEHRPEINLRKRLESLGHIVYINGKDATVTVAGLLMLIHECGIKEINTEIIEHDRESKFCIVQATLKGARGVYTGYGDACPQSTNRMVQAHYIRVAESRAIARAARWYLGIGLTASNEIVTGE